MQRRRDAIARLGAPWFRCPRCWGSSRAPLVDAFIWPEEPGGAMQSVRVCASCKAKIGEENHLRVTQRIDRLAAEEQAKADLDRQQNTSSSYEYRRACAQMAREMPELKRWGW